MPFTADKLMRMKSQIEKAKLEQARLEGEKHSLYKRLKEEFGCANLTEAQRKLSKMDKDIDRQESQLEKAVKKLEDDYVWN